MSNRFRRVPSRGVLILLSIQTVLLVGLNRLTSLNRTEIGHLGAAVYFWETGRCDVFHVNPPLTRMICGIPVVLMAPKYDWRPYSPRPQDRCEWSLGSAFINANTPEKIRRCVFGARCALVPLILWGSWCGYRFASELYNEKSGLIFLTLWVFSPLVLGWGATICPDVVAASLGIVAAYRFWRWLESPTWRNAIFAGTTLGLLPLAKTTWVIAPPIWFVLWLFRRIRRGKSEETIPLPGAKQLVAIFFVAVYVLNMGYGFDGTGRLLKDYTFMSRSLAGAEQDEKNRAASSGNRFAETAWGYVPVPLPAEFVLGIDTQKRDFETGLQSYFRGETSQRGWWYYYPYILFVREPLGVWGLVLLTIGVCVFGKLPLDWKDESVLLLPILAIAAILCTQNGFSIHPRYVILIVPFAYLGVAKLGLMFSAKHKIVTVLTTVLLLWFAGSSLSYYPHTMSYFNESVGGAKNGPKHLLGSNVDWGQNLYFLKSWVENHPSARPLYVNYASTDSLQRLGIEDVRPVPQERRSGWYALDVNEIYGTKQYEDFKTRDPVDRIGWGIYVYHIEK